MIVDNYKYKTIQTKIIVVILLVFWGSAGWGQQLTQYSQYLVNDYVMNPAIGGSRDYWEAKSNQRNQWLGITDAPRTYMLSMNGPIGSQKMGLGGYIFNDHTGPTNRFGIYGSYAYHIKVTEKAKVSLGLFGGVMQFVIDGTQITLQDNNDPVMKGNMYSVWLPDAGFGAYLYNENYFFGASIPQLINDKLHRQVNHFYIMGGYKIAVGENFQVEPSLLMKAVSPVPVQFDIGLRGLYRNTVWIGLAYRTNDAASALVGYIFKDMLLIGYSFDFTISDIRNYTSGTHEIMMGLRFRQKVQEKEGLIE